MFQATLLVEAAEVGFSIEIPLYLTLKSVKWRAYRLFLSAIKRWPIDQPAHQVALFFFGIDDLKLIARIQESIYLQANIKSF